MTSSINDLLFVLWFTINKPSQMHMYHTGQGPEFRISFTVLTSSTATRGLHKHNNL